MASEFSDSVVKASQPDDAELDYLRVIWFTEEMGFFDLCNALRKVNLCPEKGDSTGWGNLFRTIAHFETMGWVECSRKGRNIETLKLTDLGASFVREAKDKGRPLFNVDDDDDIFDL